jgi:hypothetical protein
MTRVLVASLLLLVACDEQTLDAPWQLDRDRVVAVRAEPPHIAPGEIATFEALIAREGEPASVATPVNATAPNAPARLFTAVHFYIDHWRVDGPDEAALDAARAELGLPAGAPVPLDVTLALPGPLYARKTVWLGDRRANPPPPAFMHGPVLAAGREYTLRYNAPPGGSVRWLTSCGVLVDDTAPQATHIVDEPCEGELVLVVRDSLGGVAWQILPLRVE